MIDTWIVGKYVSGDRLSVVWDFAGVYDNEKSAVAACRDENYFIMPAEMNKQLPDERIEDENTYYPLLQAKPKVIQS